MTPEPTTVRRPLHWLALALFAVTVLLSINAVKLGIGPIPIRFMTLIVSGACLALADAERFGDAIKRSRKLIAIVASLALLGIVVSLIAAAPPADFLRQVVEIHIQAIIGAVVAYALMLRFGITAVLVCFLGSYAVSAVVAIGQALQIDAAWGARAAIGRLMKDVPLTQELYIRRERALGLSFSPVHFGTQTCHALTAVLFIRFNRNGLNLRQPDWTLVAAGILFMTLVTVTGNRSPLLGMLIFFTLYGFIVAPRLMVVGLPMALLAAVALPILMDNLSQAGVRVAETEDGSAAGRSTLRAFGLYLIGERPIGYGLTFNSLDYWPSFMHRAIYLDHSLAFREWPVHNYYLNVLAKYGVLILFVVPFIFPRDRLQWSLWFSFVPYIVHIFYHNEGPMQGDFMIFFLLPAALLLLARESTKVQQLHRSAAHSWRRAFADPVI